MAEKKIKWGVIGSGGIARRRTIPEGILRAPHAKLVSVYDINVAANEAIALETHSLAAGNISDLLDTDIDAVYIASPVNLHLNHVTVCAGAKKHVFCEKPLGLSVEEAKKIIEACEKSGVLLGTAYMMRFMTQHQAALKLIREGKLGKPVYARAQLSCWYPPIDGAWRQSPLTGGGGSLIDMGSHCMDLLEMFFGKVKKVNCFINNRIHSYQSEDSAVVTLYFENGALATVDTFYCIPDNSSKNILELYGSKGSIIARGTIGQGSAGEMTAYLECDNSGYDAGQTRNNGDGLAINPVPLNTYQAEIEDFCLAILEKRKPMNDELIGIHSQQLIEACYQSAKSGNSIEIVYE